ncbi:MAG: hypothetical protein J4215_04995 [Candidatus Diapherotrites archaeon]|uniref:Uncharacterized protein n=1 Tax=Candidatus Iainarchaeum sp. TaxID=3101447 RepID=A0A8T4LB34_9ARCH|nr:hypothetical protein [Candidatus Diapherotrites archaeon]
MRFHPSPKSGGRPRRGLSITNDFTGVARPLDGDKDGSARFDVGPFEFR